MAFQGLSLKTENRDYVDFPGLSSIMSLSYVSKLDYPDTTHNKNISTNNNTRTASNHFVQSVDMMNFVPGFRSEHSSRFCDLSKTLGSSNNIKKFDSYSQFNNSMNIFSSLVGGFVGSKSQVGCTSMQGYKFQIWDLVWQKLIEIMGNDSNKSSTKPQQESISQCLIDQTEGEKNEEPVKQTYAEVAKTLPRNLSNKNNHTKGSSIVKEKAVRSNKQKRKQPVVLDCNYRGRLDFGRCEKKISLHEMDSFSSSRWSNSRRKHFRKGVEKLNKRNVREAARDGLDFVNQELNRVNTHADNILMVNNSINCNLHRGNIKKSIKTNVVETSLTPKEVHCSDDLEKNSGCVKSDDSKTNSSEIYSDIGSCSNEVEYSAIISPVSDDFRCRLGSMCSVDSDDSFIVFDGSNDDIITQICLGDFDLETEEDDSDVSSTSFSDNDSDAGDSYIVVQSSFNRKPFQAQIDSALKNKNCRELSEENKEKTPNKSVRFKITSKGIQENICSKLKSVISMPFTVNCDLDNIKCFSDVTDGERKCRSASESSVDSEDSFIIFGYAEDETFSPCKRLSYSPSSDFAVPDDNSDYSDEDYDEISSAVLTPYNADHCYDTKSWLEEVNSDWEGRFNVETECIEEKPKKVHFAPDDKLVAVKRMVTWNYALQAARIGPWEQLARDTMRFQNRIRCTGEVLQSVLESNHREQIWMERFSDLYKDNEKINVK